MLAPISVMLIYLFIYLFSCFISFSILIILSVIYIFIFIFFCILEMRATEVVLCNAGMVGMGHDIRWGPGISVDDGAIDLVFIEATSVADYVSVIRSLGTGETSKNKRIKYLRAYDSIEISSEQEAPVAGDGDLMGNLPISVKVIAGAVNVLLPRLDKGKNSSAIF